MSTKETKGEAKSKKVYGSPEIVHMGDAREITAGGGDPLSDGFTQPKSYKDPPGGHFVPTPKSRD